MKFFLFSLLNLLLACEEVPEIVLDGEVIQVGSRIHPVSGSLRLVEQSFAVSLRPSKDLSHNLREILGNNPVVFECETTRCSVLKPGDLARFVCRVNRYTDSPGVLVCRFDRFL